MSLLVENDKKYIAGTYARFPVEIISGEGSIAYGPDGKRYIDLGSGIGVTAFGYSDNAWVEAITDQLKKLQHTSNLYYTDPCVKLAQMLCDRTGFKKVFFANSGAEANECAIKVARKYAAEKKEEQFYNIVTLKNSFHGRTLTTLAATGQDHYHELYNPLTPGFLHCDANDFEQFVKITQTEKVAAVMIECIQGEGGVNLLDKDFVTKLCNYSKENDITVIVDEVQTGNGRTGELYAYMNFGISPDIVTTAKGLGGGLPIGAALLSQKVESVMGFGDHGSTFGGNPVCCAGAVNILERIDDTLLAEVKEKGKLIKDTLEGAKGIESVSGLGLMLGIKTTKPAKDVVMQCIDKGVLCLTAKDKVRLLPPLNIPKQTLLEALDIIKKICADI